MNVETGLESFFSSLENQNFSGGQKWETLEHRGAIEIQIGNTVSMFKATPNHVAKLSLP